MMKYLAVLSLFILFACGSDRNEVRAELLNEQEILKDSANNLNESIGSYLQKDLNDSAEAKRKQQGAVYARLTAIQSSIDSLEKMK